MTKRDGCPITSGMTKPHVIAGSDRQSLLDEPHVIAGFDRQSSPHMMQALHPFRNALSRSAE